MADKAVTLPHLPRASWGLPAPGGGSRRKKTVKVGELQLRAAKRQRGGHWGNKPVRRVEAEVSTEPHLLKVARWAQLGR